MSSVSSTSLAVTLAHAVSYLTRPLNVSMPSAAISKLQTALEANLAAAYVSTWNPAAPLAGSGRRCLSFSPACLPPRPVYNACTAAGIAWADWSRALCDAEFDLFVDPGCVAVRVSAWGPAAMSKLITIWSAELEAQASAQAQAQLAAPRPRKTLAQRLMEDDCEEEEMLFEMIEQEMREPAWITPILEQFPRVPGAGTTRPTPGHSRSSSRSSITSSSACSDESLTSCATFSSATSLSSSAHSSAYSIDSAGAKRQSRRERARQARVYVDTSKTDVTPYDGGKTTVLTGGVMLGAAPSGAAGVRKMRRN